MTELDQHTFLALPVDADPADGKGRVEGSIRVPATVSCVTSVLTRTHCPVFSPGEEKKSNLEMQWSGGNNDDVVTDTPGMRHSGTRPHSTSSRVREAHGFLRTTQDPPFEPFQQVTTV